jgi:hypothetical protein
MSKEEVLPVTQQLDEEYIRLSKKIFPALRYVEVKFRNLDNSLDIVHNQPNCRVPHIWNSLRMTRRLWNEIMHVMLSTSKAHPISPLRSAKQ